MRRIFIFGTLINVSGYTMRGRTPLQWQPEGLVGRLDRPKRQFAPRIIPFCVGHSAALFMVSICLRRGVLTTSKETSHSGYTISFLIGANMWNAAGPALVVHIGSNKWIQYAGSFSAGGFHFNVQTRAQCFIVLPPRKVMDRYGHCPFAAIAICSFRDRSENPQSWERRKFSTMSMG